jgi:toxin YoeB
MKLIFSEDAWDDYLYWQKHDRKMVERVNKLIVEGDTVLLAQLRYHY